MSETVTIELVGAKTYATLAAAYRADQPYEVAAPVWAALKDEAHPVTGAVLFALWTERPAASAEALDEIDFPLRADRASPGAELDTASNGLDLDDTAPDGADRSDLNDAPAAAAPEETKRKITVGRKPQDAVQV